MSKLFKVLAKNTQLKFINLSFNQLVHDVPTKVHRKVLSSKDADPESPDFGASQLSDFSRKTIENVSKFLRRNKNLVHADLSNTGLSEAHLWYFGSTLRRAISLRSLHLSGNPGVTQRLKNYLCERVHCITVDKDSIA